MYRPVASEKRNTSEGEFALVNLPGGDAGDFHFHGARRGRGTLLPGGHPAVTCQQHIGIPGSCFGEAGYFIGVWSVE